MCWTRCIAESELLRLASGRETVAARSPNRWLQGRDWEVSVERARKMLTLRASPDTTGDELRSRRGKLESATATLDALPTSSWACGLRGLSRMRESCPSKGTGPWRSAR